MSRSPSGARVLVVEDRDEVQAIAVAILSRLSCHVRVAANARAALAAIEEGETIDIVFADIRLPGGVSGLDLARTVRQRWPEIKILLTSGDPGTDDVRGAARADAFPLVAKPYRPGDLAGAIRQLFEDRTPAAKTA